VGGVTKGLPVEVTSFVGRRDELARIRSTLRDAHVVTLTGAGGIGKTRLAARAAASLARQLEVCFVDLTSVAPGSGLDHVTGAAAALLAVPPERLVDHVRDGRLLFVLDNCEHVLAAVAAFATTLVRAGAELRILATSREPLRVDGEHVIDVPPLTEAVELLRDRARQVLGAEWEPDAEAADELCRRLDGLPLAIELAAPMLRAVPLDALADSATVKLGRLAAPAQPHHRTLHATFAWSHELCDDAQRLLWRRLAVFPASFDLAAVTAVCGLEPDDVLSTLVGLVDKSVVRSEVHDGRRRWRLLQPVREYGAELLAASGEQETLLARHRDYYLAQTHGWATAWVSADEVAYLHAFEHDMPHLRQALEWSLTTPGQQPAAQLLAVNLAKSHAWFARGNLAEGQEWLRRAQEIEAPAEGRAVVLGMAVWMASLRGESALAAELLPLCQQAMAALPPDAALAAALNMAEGTYRWLSLGDPTAADQLELARKGLHGTSSERFMATLFCGIARGQLADSEAAREALDECLATAAADGAQWSSTWAEWLTGLIIRYERPAEAAELFARTLRRSAAIGDRWGTAWSLLLLGWTSAALGNHRQAARLMGATDRCWRDIGVRFSGLKTWNAERRGWLAVVEAALPAAEYRRAVAAGEATSFADVVDFAIGSDEPPGRESTADGVRLTRREREVAELVAAGLTTPQIAKALFVGERTVESHIANAMRKLGVTRRAGIASWVARAG
jgi:non-specific serine/threonine protein kinase